MMIISDAIKGLGELPNNSAQCCVTSPPYWKLRSYLDEDHPDKAAELGQEDNPEEYVARVVEIFREVRRVLRPDGTCWLNLGDTYASGGNGGGGSLMEERGAALWKAQKGRTGWRSPPHGLKHKDLVGIPWMVAFALRADGWYLRSEVTWHKPNAMPESVTDRPSRSTEKVFLLTRSSSYYYDADAIREPAVRGASGSRFDRGKFPRRRTSTAERVASDTRNARDVWRISTQPYSGAHYAAMPPLLAQRCILAGSAPGDVVLDPPTQLLGNHGNGPAPHERWIGIDIDERNRKLLTDRTRQGSLMRYWA